MIRQREGQRGKWKRRPLSEQGKQKGKRKEIVFEQLAAKRCRVKSRRPKRKSWQKRKRAERKIKVVLLVTLRTSITGQYDKNDSSKMPIEVKKLKEEAPRKANRTDKTKCLNRKEEKLI